MAIKDITIQMLQNAGYDTSVYTTEYRDELVKEKIPNGWDLLKVNSIIPNNSMFLSLDGKGWMSGKEYTGSVLPSVWAVFIARSKTTEESAHDEHKKMVDFFFGSRWSGTGTR
jgi:hypothetical protein